MHTPLEFEKFPWLNEKIREIGFLLPALSNEDAKQFGRDLEGYGFTFQETERGFLVRVEDLEKLLSRIADEFAAERTRARAA